jgi:hypothetical protein
VQGIEKKQAALESEMQHVSKQLQDDGSDAVLAVMESLGVQKYLDEWCNDGDNCRQGIDGQLKGTLYAR